MARKVHGWLSLLVPCSLMQSGLTAVGAKELADAMKVNRSLPSLA
jgi:hypothetical protein